MLILQVKRLIDPLNHVLFCSLDGPLDHSDDTENDDADEDENEVELEGAVGGDVTLPAPQRPRELQETRTGEEAQTSLLEELQKEIDRLRLLSPGGESNHVQLTLKLP